MPQNTYQLLTADAVIPMEDNAQAFLERAGVILQADRIIAVGSLKSLRQQFPDLEEHYTSGIMLPGLINAHTHLELGYQRAPVERPPYFTDWVNTLMRNYPPTEKIDDIVSAAVIAGAAESLRSGVTTVGDISRHCTLTRKILSSGPLRVISFGEIIGLGKMRARSNDFLNTAADRTSESPSLTVALSPHAPYTVEGPTLQKVVERAIAGNYPITMHLAELAEELAFLKSAGGPLADWAVMKNILDAQTPRYSDGPLRWAEQWGLLGPSGASTKVPVVLAHVNYCDDDGLSLLTQSNASVVYCPRTHAYFGHQDQYPPSPHRYREMLAAGINVCLGTDSLASNPDLSVLSEAALLCQRDSLPAYTAMELITRRGAHALGLNSGVLAAGKMADISIFPDAVRADLQTTLENLLEGPGQATAVWIAGVPAK